jgi:hypothetical protein
MPEIEKTDTQSQEAVFPEPQAEVEIGVSPVGELWGGLVSGEEANIPDVSISELDKMMKRDGTAAALYNVLSLPIRAAKWHVVPAEEGEEEANFINAMFTEPPHRGGMTTPMGYIISVATKALRQGFVLWEKVYRIGSIQYPDADGHPVKRDNVILLKKLAHRPSDHITFKTDRHGGLDGAIQRTSYKGEIIEAVFPVEKIVVYTVNKHENPLYGQSIFNSAYHHYDKKHKLYFVAHLAYLLNAIPPRMGKYPANTSKALQAAFKRALANLGTNAVVTLPKFPGEEVAQYQVELLEAKRPLADMMPMINHHNAEMAKSVLAQFIELGQNGKGGAYALSSDQSDLFILALEAYMQEIAYTINNYLIPEFIDWNFGTGKYPQFQFEPLADSTKALLKETFKTLSAVAYKQVTDEFMLELEQRVAEEFGFALDYGEIKQRVEEEKALMQEQKPPVGNQLGEGGLSGYLTKLRDEFAEEIAEFEKILGERE